MTGGEVRRLSVHGVAVDARTRWSFVEVQTRSGRIGTGEATVADPDGRLADAVAALASPLLGRPAPPLGRTGSPAGLVEAAARSALDLALCDLAAQEAGVPLLGLFGRKRRDAVPIYANVNRRTRDRSPEGFAASARDAVAAGYSAIKVAPFDEVTGANGDGLLAAGPGIDRIRAVRDAVGTKRRLMVDCHWRFDEPSAAGLIDRLADIGLHWLECPIPETSAAAPALRRLRKRANAAGMLLAGLEQAVGLGAFLAFDGCYDVMMPDVKYAGGAAEMLAIADALAERGVAVSPHNPSGPVSHVASLHLSTVMPGFDMLEHQFDETPLFAALVSGSLPPTRNGLAEVGDVPGLGVRLRPDVLASVGADTRHFDA